MEKIFSGEKSEQLWNEINNLDALSTGDDIRDVIYSLVCKLQELETEIEKLQNEMAKR